MSITLEKKSLIPINSWPEVKKAVIGGEQKKIIKTGTVKRAMKTAKELNDRIITLMWNVCVISRLDCR